MKFNKELYTITEIHEGFGLSKTFINSLIREKKLKAVMIGGIWRITAEGLKDYLSTCERNFDIED